MFRHRWEKNIKLDLREMGCDGRSGCNWFRVWISVGINEHTDNWVLQQTFFWLDQIRFFSC